MGVSVYLFEFILVDPKTYNILNFNFFIICYSLADLLQYTTDCYKSEYWVQLQLNRYNRLLLVSTVTNIRTEELYM